MWPRSYWFKAWRIFPQWRAAQNQHNGTWAVWDNAVVRVVNVPATFMLEDLAGWIKENAQWEPC